MRTRTLLRSSLLLAALAALVLNSHSSSQEPLELPDGFQLRQPAGGTLIDDVDTPAAAPVIAPFEQLRPANVLPDGFEVDGPVGTLIFENEDGTRARTPAFEFDTARPLVLEYMELQGQLAERLTDDQLDAEITELRQTLQVLDADEELQEIRQSLQRLIESRPDTPAAAAARRALEQLEPGGGRNNPLFDLDSNS